MSVGHGQKSPVDNVIEAPHGHILALHPENSPGIRNLGYDPVNYIEGKTYSMQWIVWDEMEPKI